MEIDYQPEDNMFFKCEYCEIYCNISELNQCRYCDIYMCINCSIEYTDICEKCIIEYHNSSHDDYTIHCSNCETYSYDISNFIKCRNCGDIFCIYCISDNSNCYKCSFEIEFITDFKNINVGSKIQEESLEQKMESIFIDSENDNSEYLI
jgi:hypothetical protein